MNPTMKPNETVLVLYSKVLEEIMTCYNSNRAISKLDRGMNRMLDDIAKLDKDVTRGEVIVSSELLSEMAKNIQIKVEERRLLAIERDCERL